MLRAMLQNLIKIFRTGELLSQKRLPINPDNRKLRNASNHIYRHIVKLFVGFLSHVLSTLIRRIVLNAHGIRSFICSMDNMRAICIHHEPCFLRERDGLSTDRACIKSSSLSKQIRALLSRTSAHFHAFSRTQIPITYFTLMRDEFNVIAKEINDAP